MPAFLKDLIVITPILVGAAYGVMRLVVWLLTENGRRPKWSGKFAQLFIWSVALSSLLVNITVAASNFKHKLDIRSPWAKGALIFAAAVAFIYPVCHGAAVAINKDYHWLDFDILLFWTAFSAGIVGLLSVYTLSFFYAIMDDAENSKIKVPSLFDNINDIPSYNDSNDSYKAPKYKPMNLYRSSYDDPDPAREDIFREYAETDGYLKDDD